MALDGCERCTSDNVYFECRNVFIRNKLVVPPFLNAIENYEGSLNRSVNEIWVREYVWIYVDSHKLGDEQKKTLLNFVRRNLDDIVSMLTGQIDRQAYIAKILKAIKVAINILDRDCNCQSTKICRYSTCQDYSTSYRAEFNSLRSVIPNKNDVTILIDSYYVRNNYLHRDVCFITMDKEHIVSNKDHIEKTIVGIKIKQLT
jgi:hypothetical protein